MTTKKCLFTIAMSILLSTVSFSQSGLQKILTTTLQPGESNLVLFDLPGKVDIETWDRNYIRVEINVKTNLNNEEVFKYLKEIGRYDLGKSQNTYYSIVANLPKVDEKVLVNGMALEEAFEFKVIVPWNMDVGQGNNSDLAADINFGDDEGNDLLANQIEE